MWTDCMLDGADLDAEVTKWAREVGLVGFGVSLRPTQRPEHAMLLVESQQIFLSPPHDVRRCGGPNAGWEDVTHWEATVSARTRTFNNAHGYDCVGRGIGPTAAIAAARAFVASCKDVREIPF